MKALDIYSSLYCNSHMLEFDTNNICSDPLSFLMSKAGYAIDYIDPHRCAGSCADPVPYCDACTNSEYFFCKKNNAREVFKK